MKLLCCVTGTVRCPRLTCALVAVVAALPSTAMALPRLLIIGDSISIGYTEPVRDILTGQVEVHRIPGNGSSTWTGLEKLDAWLADQHWDVIHFNWGLHDLKHMKDNKLDLAGRRVSTREQYEAHLEQLVRRLQATGARLIWASTTPIPSGAAGRIQGQEVEFNTVARRIMEKHGVAIDDLHAHVLPRLDEFQQPHNVHFTPAGSRFLAEQVARSVLAALRDRVPPSVAGDTEPDVQTAARWWPPLTNVYTPVGWKNHLFRFNVYYNGVIMANPCPEPDVKALAPWCGLGAQISILPSEQGLDPDRWRAGTYQMTTDGGRRWGYQGLLDRPTPVIWTEWRQSFRAAVGFVLRQEVFAHLPGGQDIRTGQEPLFAWVRMSIRQVNPLMQPAPCVILVRINKPHVFPEMYEGRNLALRTTDALYPHELNFELTGDGTQRGCLLIEQSDKVRLGVLPGQATKFELLQKARNGQDTNLLITLPVKKEAYVDLLVPMLPEPRAVFEQEMGLGREHVLAECDAYWSKLPPTAARIDTPEPYVNQYLLRNAQYGEIIAQKMLDTGHYTNLTGSQIYARMWATPTTMFDTMLLDTLGYHEAVARYLEIFRDTQGTVKPPGPAYERHPGYFATPPGLTSVDWLSDHGAILHAVCYHALVTGDEGFIDRWLPSILKACEFIRDARARRDHDGVPGVLPPAVATDRGIATQAVWNIGWHYRGLTSAVALLKRLNHPQADPWARQAGEFRDTFVRALRQQTQHMPSWTDADGRTHHIVPTSLSGGEDFSHAFYLDTGPLFLVYAGLLDARDPLMQSTLRFFREGPNHLAFDPYGNHEQPAVLVHEISSCEPCASFNLFHSHQLGDRPRFLEGMYSLLTGAHSQQTYTACETRGGITGLPGHLGIYAVRLCMVDDLVEPDTLHLLRLVPRAWLRPGHTTRFERIPTVFGPVTINFELDPAGTSLQVDYSARFHHPPRQVILHAPPVPGLSEWVVNGKRNSAQSDATIVLD